MLFQEMCECDLVRRNPRHVCRQESLLTSMNSSGNVSRTWIGEITDHDVAIRVGNLDIWRRTAGKDGR